MNKLFEVPYNFSKTLLSFYKKNQQNISFLFVPPYMNDSINTRTSIETHRKGSCYMPRTREEYEEHLNNIVKAGLKFVILWQDPNLSISKDMILYYKELGAAGFIIGNNDSAKIIKDIDANLVVICSLVQRICSQALTRDFKYYDKVLLYYPYNRGIDALKELFFMKEKIILMPNTLCHVDCPSMHHWFPNLKRNFSQKTDCPAIVDVTMSGFSRWSFRNYFNDSKKENLSQKWKAVRHTFLRLKDMYDNIYSYHYIGGLTYNSNRNPINNITRWLALNRELTHSEFINRLRSEIKTILTRKHKAITEYSYYSDKKDLRLLFLMHNIETILQRFEQLHEDERLSLENEYEKFPFELLHRQSWDIEHISSNTDSDFRNSADRKAWLESIKQDLGNEYTKDENSKIKELEMIYSTSEKREDFNRLYTAIMRQYDDKTDSIKDNAPDGKDKMQIGNLTLLDSSTNRSYHNALFPRKRRYIIVADGISDKSDKFESSLTPRYIPPCTRQVFTKAYNKTNKLSLNAWTQEDADFYVKDMEQKLGYYFNNEKI